MAVNVEAVGTILTNAMIATMAFTAPNVRSPATTTALPSPTGTGTVRRFKVTRPGAAGPLTVGGFRRSDAIANMDTTGTSATTIW